MLRGVVDLVEHTWDTDGGRIRVIFFRDEGRVERMALVQYRAERSVWAATDPARLALLGYTVPPEWQRDGGRAVLPAWVVEALLAGLPKAPAGTEGAERAPEAPGACCWLAGKLGEPAFVGDPPLY